MWGSAEIKSVEQLTQEKGIKRHAGSSACMSVGDTEWWRRTRIHTSTFITNTPLGTNRAGYRQN